MSDQAVVIEAEHYDGAEHSDDVELDVELDVEVSIADPLSGDEADPLSAP